MAELPLTMNVIFTSAFSKNTVSGTYTSSVLLFIQDCVYIFFALPLAKKLSIFNIVTPLNLVVISAKASSPLLNKIFICYCCHILYNLISLLNSFTSPKQQIFLFTIQSLEYLYISRDLLTDAHALLGVLHTCGNWLPQADAKLAALADLIQKKHPKTNCSSSPSLPTPPAT